MLIGQQKREYLEPTPYSCIGNGPRPMTVNLTPIGLETSIEEVWPLIKKFHVMSNSLRSEISYRLSI